MKDGPRIRHATRSAGGELIAVSDDTMFVLPRGEPETAIVGVGREEIVDEPRPSQELQRHRYLHMQGLHEATPTRLSVRLCAVLRVRHERERADHGRVEEAMILVDPITDYTGITTLRHKQWSHMVSDVSLDELHRMAHEIGLRRSWFQGDHYDVTPPRRAHALRLGAVEVTKKELVIRLRASGLRKVK